MNSRDINDHLSLKKSAENHNQKRKLQQKNNSANEEGSVIRLYNTLSKQKERFTSIEPGYVSLYTCGPTVYHYAHIGNLRTYIFEDILKKTLSHAGYQVNHVMNITDVGHLQSDADEGDDKMVLATKREQKNPWEIAKFYEKAFFLDCNELRIASPTIICRATDHINNMIAFVSGLEKSGYTYNVQNNIYFDISKFANYTSFARLKLLKENAVGRVEKDDRKKNPQDFVLWFSESKYPNQIMKWESPWGMGFPGWHIECSAMAMHYLGEHIDIHCGGRDHISIHHTNEIAQSEALTGKKWVNYWMHGGFLVDEAGKMSKSSGGFITLKTLTDIGFEPGHYRYFCLSGHYRNDLKFSYAALEMAREKYEALKVQVIKLIMEVESNNKNVDIPNGNDNVFALYQKQFWQALNDDLQTAQAIKSLWAMVMDKHLTAKEKLTLLYEFDQVLGLGVHTFRKPALDENAVRLLELRSLLRKQGYFQEADKIRDAFAGSDINVHIEDMKDMFLLSNRKKLDYKTLQPAKTNLDHPDITGNHLR